MYGQSFQLACLHPRWDSQCKMIRQGMLIAYVHLHELLWNKSYAVFVQYCYLVLHLHRNLLCFIYDNVKNWNNWVKLTKNMFGSYFTPKPKFQFSSLPFYFILYGILLYKNKMCTCLYVCFVLFLLILPFYLLIIIKNIIFNLKII